MRGYLTDWQSFVKVRDYALIKSKSIMAEDVTTEEWLRYALMLIGVGAMAYFDAKEITGITNNDRINRAKQEIDELYRPLKNDHRKN